MQGALECHGQIRFSSLPWEISERLAQFRGNWLEFVPESNAILMRQAYPGGCPALTGVACELITIIDSLPAQYRESMPGGELSLADAEGPMLWLSVRHGEVRINWPKEPLFQCVCDFPETAVRRAGSRTLVRGWARFTACGDKSEEVKSFVDRFGGLYPEEDMPSECEQDVAYLRFKDVDLDPQQLIADLLKLAEPRESLQAVLEISTMLRGAVDHEYRIQIVDGRARTEQPVLAR